jgi:hypothetical protein
VRWPVDHFTECDKGNEREWIRQRKIFPLPISHGKGFCSSNWPYGQCYARKQRPPFPLNYSRGQQISWYLANRYSLVSPPERKSSYKLKLFEGNFIFSQFCVARYEMSTYFSFPLEPKLIPRYPSFRHLSKFVLLGGCQISIHQISKRVKVFSEGTVTQMKILQWPTLILDYSSVK